MKRERNYVFITMLIGVVLLLYILPLGHDLWYHLYRIGAMGAELKKSPLNLPIRMLADTYNGYGYGAALYYGDTFLYFPAILAAAGMDVVLVYKLFTAAMWLGAFGIAYYTGKMLEAKKEYCMLYAYLYTFSSCFILNLCIRSAVGETLAMVFLPLVFGSFYCILYRKEPLTKYWILLALSMAAVAVSHMISLLWCGIILCIWALVEWKRVFTGKKWVEIIKAAIFMIGLSASFLFPMFEQMLYQKVQTASNNDYQKQEFMKYGIEWMDYFISYDVKKILVSLFGIDWDIETWHPGAIGLFAVLLVFCIVFFKIKLSVRTKIIGVCSLTGLLILGMPPIMNIAKEYLSFMQFSWRILPFITVGLTAVALRSAEKAESKKVDWTLYIGTFIIAATIIVPRYGYQILLQWNDYEMIREESPELYDKYQFRYDANAADSMYLPEHVYGGTYEERGETVTADQELDFIWERNGDEIYVDIIFNPYEEVWIEFPLYIYKGYAGVTEEGEELIPKRSKDGLVCINVADYEGRIVVSYKGTLCQKVSDMITLITLAGFVIISCRKKKSIL